MNEETYGSLCTVIDYLYEVEKKNFIKADKDSRKYHIFPDIQRIKDWINEVAKDYKKPEPTLNELAKDLLTAIKSNVDENGMIKEQYIADEVEDIKGFMEDRCKCTNCETVYKQDEDLERIDDMLACPKCKTDKYLMSF